MEENHGRIAATKRGRKMLLKVSLTLGLLCVIAVKVFVILRINGGILDLLNGWVIKLARLRHTWEILFPKKREKKRR